MRGSIIDDLARFRCAILWDGAIFYRTILRVAWTQLH